MFLFCSLSHKNPIPVFDGKPSPAFNRTLVHSRKGDHITPHPCLPSLVACHFKNQF